MNARTYEIGQSTITLLFGDITRSSAEVLVSSDDFLLSMGGGVSYAIRRAGGASISAHASKLVPARVGDVVVSAAGDLPARYIFHAITIGSHSLDLPPQAVVRLTCQRAMQLLSILGCTSIAFPAIGAGVAGISYEVVASEMAVALVHFLLEAPQAYQVELYLLDRYGQMGREDFFMFFEAFAAQKYGLSASAGAAQPELRPPGSLPQAMSPAQQAEAERRHQVYLMLRHLDARRSQLEAELLQALTGAQEQPLDRLREQLDQVQKLRQGYEEELMVTGKQEPPGQASSVFVSSTNLDLKPYRQVVRDVIQKLRLQFIGMEEFTPTTTAPADLIRRKVQQAQVYLGILGMRYGYIDPGSGLSMTELEYRQAVASDKRICMFVMDQSAPILASMVESDPKGFSKLCDFRNQVMQAHTCALFTDPPDLAQKVEATLKETAPV